MQVAPGLPIVDLSEEEGQAAAVLAHACKTQGFFYLVTHGVGAELIQDMFRAQKQFFSLPLSAKEEIRSDSNNRGYTPMGDETLNPSESKRPDTHEGLYFGRDLPADSPECVRPLHGPNQWPREELLPGYKATTAAYFAALADLGMRTLPVLALSLGLARDHFDAAFSQPMLALRPLHYNAEPSSIADGVLAAGAHTDYGCLTFLMTDGTPGLQLKSEAGWVDVPQLPGAYTVNIGDMLERWTNGLYRSTMHRVVNTTGRERYSIPFFFEPNFDTVVEVLDSCTSPDRPSLYPPTTSGQHLLDKYNATHSGYAALSKGSAAQEAAA